jgi:hypothetical protein
MGDGSRRDGKGRFRGRRSLLNRGRWRIGVGLSTEGLQDLVGAGKAIARSRMQHSL